MRRVIGQVAGNVLARLGVIGLTLIASVLTARLLGPSGRGEYFAVVTFAGLVAQFSNLGLSSSNSYYAAQDRDRSWALLVNSSVLATAVVILVSLVLGFGNAEVATILDAPESLLWFAPALGGSILLFHLSCSVLSANERFLELNLLQVGSSAAVVVGMLIVGALAPSPGAFLFVTTIAALGSALFGVGIQVRANTEFRPDLNMFRLGIGFAGRAYLALLIGYAIPRIGVLFLGRSHGSAELGQFSIAVQAFDLIAILPSALAMVIFPRLVRDSRDRWGVTWSSLWLTVGFVILASVAILLVGEQLIVLVFGAAFAPSYAVVLSLLPGAAAYSATSILSQYIVSHGFPFQLVLTWLLGLAVTLVCALRWVPALGSIGAGWAQSAGLIFVLCGALILAINTREAARQ